MTTATKKSNQQNEGLPIEETSFDKFVKDALSNDKAATFQELFDIPECNLEALYEKAYHYYKQGNNEYAGLIFHLLASLNPYVQKYWMGLGAARQLEKKYTKALCSFAIATLLDAEDPRPNFYSAECYLSLKKPKNAKKELMLAKQKLDHPRGTEIMKQRILLMQETIKQTTRKKIKGKKQ